MGLTRNDLSRSSVEVAPLLLGAVLHVGSVAVRLTEVEAYAGSGDPGSHAYRGMTPRTAPMFGEAGHLYVYLSYGMHACANVVTGEPGVASAVLLRAGEVVRGLELARARRSTTPSGRQQTEPPHHALARGPANLARALGLRVADSGRDACTDEVHLEGPRSPPADYRSGPRVGVSGSGGSAAYPWRFWLPGEATVSSYRPGRAEVRGRPAKSEKAPPA